MLVVAGVALGSCSTSPPPAPGCVPRVSVTPHEASPGDTITLRSDTVCSDPRPDDGWIVTAGHVGGEAVLVRTVSRDTFDGSFTAVVDLPEDFPVGEAFAGIANWDYSFCEGSGAGSCASATGDFIVRP